MNEVNLNVILVAKSSNATIPTHLYGSTEIPQKWMRLIVDNVDYFMWVHK